MTEERTNCLATMMHPRVVYCLQGNGIDRSDTAGCNGRGWREDERYTINTVDRPAVVYAIDQQGGKGNAAYNENVMCTLCSDSHGTPHAVAYPLESHPADSRINVLSPDSPTPTLTAKAAKGTADGVLVLIDNHAIAFEPGIAKREGGDSRFSEDVSPTIRANAGDNQVAVAYQNKANASEQ